MNTKYYTIDDSQNIIESNLGNLPGIEWVDINNHTYRVIIDNMVFSLKYKSILITGVQQILPYGTSDWLKVSDVNLTVNESNYRDIKTLQVVKPPYENMDNLINEFDFFLLNFGHNVYNVPLSIFHFVSDALIRKYEKV